MPCGTTGEAPTLSWEERLDIIGQCVKVASGRVPIIAGTGTSSTEATIGFTTAAESLGADAALIVTPYYNRPSQEGIFRHFEAIARKVKIPIIVYNVPARTGVDLLPQTIKRLAEIPGIVGIKDATGDLSRPLAISALVGDGFLQFSGHDRTSLGSTRWAVKERFPSLRMWRRDCASRCTMPAEEAITVPQERYSNG